MEGFIGEWSLEFSDNDDVSIHFNSSPGMHAKGIGTETLVYSVKNKAVAQRITDAIANVSGLKNRGVKIRTDLGLLNGTNKPCYLIEVCFVNDSVDVALYRRDFDKICRTSKGSRQITKAIYNYFYCGGQGGDREYVNGNWT